MSFEIRNPASFPKLLGVTDPGGCRIEDTPELIIDSGPGNTVWLYPVEAPKFTEPRAHCAAAQEIDYETARVQVKNGRLFWLSEAPNQYVEELDIQVYEPMAPKGPVEREIKLRIGADEAETLRLTELEHTEDQRHAFAITVGHLAASINKVAEFSDTGTSPHEAKTALLQRLAATAGAVFVPADPYDVEQWRARVAKLYALACGRSGMRDASDGNHHVVWWAAFGSKTLVIYPVLQGLGPTPQELITLDEIPPLTPAWTGALEPDEVPQEAPSQTTSSAARTWALGQSVLTAAQWANESVEVFKDDTLTGEPWRTLTFGQIDEETYVTPVIPLTIVKLIGDDGYLIQTELAGPDSNARQICYFQIREQHLH